MKKPKTSKLAMRRRQLLKSTITFLVLVILLGGLWTNRLNLWDWWRLRNYAPDLSIVQLADDTTMNDSTRQLFYVYHPALEKKDIFNSYCRGDNKEQSIVLGCYIGGRGIHLFDVTDERLKGVEEVTAAHEILHAAYARLSASDRARIDKLTEQAFMQLDDERLKATIESYRKQDPLVVPNELHSILGTEVANLSPELEDYYKRYFNDRSKIVGLSQQYEKNFTERKNQIQSYDAQLASIKEQIDALENNLASSNQELITERERLDSLKRSNQTSEYNALIPSYNQKVTRYNADIDRLSRLIAEYNDIVPKRNAIVSEEEDLVKAIDSRESVPPSR